MGTDIAVQSQAALALISSPELLRLRRISVGTIQWPGQPTQTYLAAGSRLTDEDRRIGDAALAELRALVVAGNTPDERRARLAIVTKMLLTYPIANASTETGKARAEAYLDALDDVPPWAIDQAVRAWHRGECGDEDYRWAPAPAALRKISIARVSHHQRAMIDLEHLLAAKTTIDEALSAPPSAADREYIISGFDKLKVDLSGIKMARTEAA